MTNRILFIFSILMSVSVLYVSTALADTISIRADSWCPYVCDDQQSPGYMVEVVSKIFEKQGHKVDFAIVNWARAVNDTRHNKITAVLAASHNDAPDFVFPTKTLGTGQDHFFVRKDSTWSYKGPHSLKNMRIGVINGYSYGSQIDELIKTKKKNFISISGEHPLGKMLKMMESKRLDGFIENETVLHFMLASMGFPSDAYKMVSMSVDDQKLYMAFSPLNPKSLEYSKILSKGLVEMRQSGELQKILFKYGLPDWEGHGLVLAGKSKNLRARCFEGKFDPLYVVNTRSF